jgi:CRP-like cAMP-binding protein
MLQNVADAFEDLGRYARARTSMTADDWQRVRAAFSNLRITKKNVYLRPGETCDRIAFLSGGCLIASYTTDKADATTHIFVERCFVADYHSYLSRTPSRQTIRAVEDCELLVADRAAMDALYATVAGWERLGRAIAEEVYVCAHDRTHSLLHDNPEERYQKVVATEPELLLRVPQYVIASYLGVTPEALSRIKRRARVRSAATS